MQILNDCSFVIFLKEKNKNQFVIADKYIEKLMVGYGKLSLSTVVADFV